jgi:hypothetical protein
MSRDRVRLLKLENPATGGGIIDFTPTAINPSQDYASLKGLTLEDDDNIRIETDGSDNIQFVDPNSGTIKLLDILNAARHRSLDQLVHNIADTSYEEYTYTSGKLTNLTIWTDNGKTIKIREYDYTYTGNKVNTIVTKQYDGTGTLVETLTDTYTYSGNNVANIDRVLT